MEILEIKKNLGTNHDDDELIATWLYVDGKMRCIPRYVDGKKYFGNPNEKCDNQSFAGCRLYIDENGNIELIDVSKFELEVISDTSALRKSDDPITIVKNGVVEVYYGIYCTHGMSEDQIRAKGRRRK